MSILMAFTTQQVADLASITRSRLRYWEQTDVFEPTYIEHRESGPYRRIYSFRDLVSLRTIARLRKEFRVPLDELRRVSAYIGESSESPWSDLAIRIYANHLAFGDPRTGEWMSSQAVGQLLLEIELDEIRNESEREARRLLLRDPETYAQVTRNRNVMSNEWVLAGTRIPVQAVVSLHNAGYSPEAIIAEYPSLVPADIDAALMHENRMRSAA